MMNSQDADTRPSGAPLYFHGIGCAYPARSVHGSEFGMLAEVGQRCGFERIRDEPDPAQTLALLLDAARSALADGKVTLDGIEGIVVVRNGANPTYDGTWMSLALARALRLHDRFCLDIKGAGCAGVLQSLSLVDSMRRPDRSGCILLVGGGASGYTHRWLRDPPMPAGGPDTGVLVGDCAHAVVVGRTPGRYEVMALELDLDPEFAHAWRREGQNYWIEDDICARWINAAPAWCARVMTSALMKARPRSLAAQPMFFVGTNAGRDSKTQLCRQYARRSDDPRFERALQLQLATMAEHGHLFGGDAISNLCTLQRAELFANGDHIMCMEVGGTYLYSAALLRSHLPS